MAPRAADRSQMGKGIVRAVLPALIRGALFCALFCALGCATEEEIEFGDPARVTGGFGNRPSASAGGTCIANPACGVSWQRDVFGAIFNAPVGGSQPTGSCGTAGCHLDGSGGLFFPPDDSDAAYAQLIGYQLAGGRPYLVGCEPGLSHMLCNLKLAPGVDNAFVGEDKSFTGGCGSPMPKSTEQQPLEPLNQQQLDTIVEWIACGAPLN